MAFFFSFSVVSMCIPLEELVGCTQGVGFCHNNPLLVQDLIADTNLDVTPTGISLQAMDTSHVALVALDLPSKVIGQPFGERNGEVLLLHFFPQGFHRFRCKRNVILGVNFITLAKIIKVFFFIFSLGRLGCISILCCRTWTRTTM
jgi:hypothetical protein